MALVAHYKMNDNAADTVVADASGNGNNGTAARNTNLTYLADGKINGCYQANGSTDKIDCGARLIGSGAFTIAAWVNLDALNLRPLVGQLGNAAGDMVFRASTDASGHLRLLRWTGTSHNMQYWTSTLVVGTVGWYHVAVVYNGTSTVTFYVDGVSESVGSPSGTASTQSSANTVIGKGTTDYFAGTIDDLRIDNEALIESRILAIFNKNRGSERPEPWNPRLVVPTILPIIQQVV